MPVPEVYQEDYGKISMPDGTPGYMVVTATKLKLWESDGSDVRLNRVREFDNSGKLIRSYLRDPAGMRFVDNLSGSEDDPEYIETLPSKVGA